MILVQYYFHYFLLVWWLWLICVVYFTDKPPTPTISINPSLTKPTRDTVTNAIKKFDQLDKQSEVINTNRSPSNQLHNNHPKPPRAPVISHFTSPKPVRKFLNEENGSTSKKPDNPAKYRYPSPSLTRKTQSFIAKEQNNEFLMSKRADKSHAKRKSSNPQSKVNEENSIKTKSESFQKAAAFWNNPH